MSKAQKKNLIITLCVMLAVAIFMAFGNLINPAIQLSLSKDFKLASNVNCLMVHYISVGNSDAIAINLPDGKVAFVDVGTGKKNSTVMDYVKNNVMVGKTNAKIDYMFLTHVDEDHIGNAKRLMEKYAVETVFMPATESDTDTYLEFKNYVAENNINTKAYLGCEDIENGYKIEIFGPVTIKQTDANASCPIIKITYNGTSFLFAGDVPTYTETKYVENYGPQLDADILKVAHHGSASSSSLVFLQKVSPNLAVISCGEGTSATVAESVLENLKTVGTEVVRTDEVGNIVVKIKDNLSLLTGNVTITNLSLDYRNLMFIIECVLGVEVVLILVIRKKHE